MARKLDTVSRFSPGNCAPELLESMLVGRHQLVDRLEKSVLESIETRAGHHWLIIGPLGAGKTHLLATLYNRIDLNREVRSRVVIAYMKEEERGVASFLDWIARILRAFHRRREEPPSDEDVDLGQGLQSLKQLPLEQAQSAAERLLLRFVGNRQLLLITENLGEIFDTTKGMGREGQQRFRDLVQQHPFWTVIASSQALFEDVQAREAPFYGFFKMHHLGMFDFDQAVALLKKLASLDGRTELRDFLGTDVGRGRTRAIHQLTGGNPRLLVIFYQFIDRESIADLASPFLEMVDSLTSYYQEQMQPLPALQQKIVEFLCERRSTATVKEIAQSCFITHQTASKQLGRLADRRYVVATTVGRESFYELREPLFRICFEVKENSGYPIRLFVDFLGMFYSMEELKRKYRSTRLLRSIYESGGKEPQTRTVDLELGYLGEALTAYHAARMEDIELEIAPLCVPDSEAIGKAVEELFSERDYAEAVKLSDAAFDLNLGGPDFLLKSIEGHRKMGDLQGARERSSRLVDSDPENKEAWLEKAAVEIAIENLDAAENCYHRVLRLEGGNEEAMVNLGIINAKRGQHNEALRLFSKAIDVAPGKSRNWCNLGSAQMMVGDMEGAQRSFERYTDLAPDSAAAWEGRGRLLVAQGDYDTAQECFQRVTELRADYGHGWRFLAFTQQKNGAIAAARESYEKATELVPDCAEAWAYRGHLLLSQGDPSGALDCYKRVTELRLDYGKGWLLLGILQAHTGDPESAEVSFERSTDLDPNEFLGWMCRARLATEQGKLKESEEYQYRAETIGANRAFEFTGLGETYRSLRLYDKAIGYFRQALELEPEDCIASFGIALTYFESENLEAGMEQMENTVRAGTGRDWSKWMPLCIMRINDYLLRHVVLDRLRDLLTRQLLIFRNTPLQAFYIQGLASALIKLLKRHERVPTDRLLAIRDQVIPELSETTELSVACRLLTTGISYLETQDRRVLLKLPREERQSLEDIFN